MSFWKRDPNQVVPLPPAGPAQDHRQVADEVATRMQRDIYDSEKILRRAAEDQIAGWRELAYDLAQRIDPGALDDLSQKNQELFSLNEYRAFFAQAWQRMDRARLWGFPYEQGQRLQEENDELRRQNEDQARATIALQAGLDALQARLSEGEVVHDAPASIAPPPHIPPFPLDREHWPPPLRGDRDAYILWLVGAKGWSLRTRLTSAHAAYIRSRGGQAKPSTGSLKKQFQYLDGTLANKKGESLGLVPPLLERERVSAGALNLILYALTDRGKTVYRRAFDAEPAESEWDRLRRLHQGASQEKHSALIMVAAFYAERYLADAVTLICPPSPRAGMEPDLHVQWAGGELYVECERSEHRRGPSAARGRKWTQQVACQKAVAVVAPTEQAQALLIGKIRDVVEPGTPLWATSVEHWRASYNEIRKIRVAQGLGRWDIPDDGAQGETWFWAVRPKERRAS